MHAAPPGHHTLCSGSDCVCEPPGTDKSNKLGARPRALLTLGALSSTYMAPSGPGCELGGAALGTDTESESSRYSLVTRGSARTTTTRRAGCARRAGRRGTDGEPAAGLAGAWTRLEASAIVRARATCVWGD